MGVVLLLFALHGRLACLKIKKQKKKTLHASAISFGNWETSLLSLFLLFFTFQTLLALRRGTEIDGVLFLLLFLLFVYS